MANIKGHSGAELALLIAQERRALIREKTSVTADLRAAGQRLADIADRLAELDKAEHLLDGCRP